MKQKSVEIENSYSDKPRNLIELERRKFMMSIAFKKKGNLFFVNNNNNNRMGRIALHLFTTFSMDYV